MKILGTAIACALCLGIASADSDQSAPRSGKSDATHRFIKKADADGDGAVSREEFAALERVARLPEAQRDEIFKRLDKNGDGVIRADEIGSARTMHEKPRRFPSLEKLDLNGDDRVSLEEFLAGPLAKRMPEARRRVLFARLDRDGDGFLTAADQRRDWKNGGQRDVRKRIFERLDRNDDDVLDYGEFSQAPWHRQLDQGQLKRRWGKLDANSDGKIDAKEFAHARKMPRRPDHSEHPERRNKPRQRGE